MASSSSEVGDTPGSEALYLAGPVLDARMGDVPTCGSGGTTRGGGDPSDLIHGGGDSDDAVSHTSRATPSIPSNADPDDEEFTVAATSPEVTWEQPVGRPSDHLMIDGEWDINPTPCDGLAGNLGFLTGNWGGGAGAAADLTAI